MGVIFVFDASTYAGQHSSDKSVIHRLGAMCTSQITVTCVYWWGAVSHRP